MDKEKITNDNDINDYFTTISHAIWTHPLNLWNQATTTNLPLLTNNRTTNLPLLTNNSVVFVQKVIVYF
jgi:hypothetical protein